MTGLYYLLGAVCVAVAVALWVALAVTFLRLPRDITSEPHEEYQ